MSFTLNGYYTLIAATLVLLLGRVLVKKIKFLDEFNIPDPVAGGLLVSILILVLHQQTGLSINIDKSLQNGLMLMFFASIGLSADFSRLKAGGLPLIVFLLLVSVFILLQNILGISLASMFGLKPLTGLITGSVTLVGGHGTAIGWGTTFEKDFGIQGAAGLGIASATFGLVLGGLVGGPVARRLIRSVATPGKAENNPVDDLTFEHPNSTRLITASSAIETLAMFAVCLSASYWMTQYMTAHFPDSNFKIPTFVWALAAGVIVRNTLSRVFNVVVFDRCVDVYGNVALSLFLAMALLSLKLWELSGLAVPVLVILAAQTVLMVLYAYFVTFRVMGKDYDAAVLAAGHCGFGMGATPTAVANMQAITDRFGPSHKAFLIVPMVGAFFIDIVNATILSIFTSIPFFH